MISMSSTPQNYAVFFSADSFSAREDKSVSSSSKYNIVTTVTTIHQLDVTNNMPKKLANPWESTNKARRTVTKLKNHSPSRLYSFEGHSLTREILERAISDANIPFSLDRLQWRGDARKDYWTPLKNQGDLLRCILDFTRCKESLVPNSAHPKEFQLVLSIEKKIILPHHEFEAMVKAASADELVEDFHVAVYFINREQSGAFSSQYLDRRILQPFRERCAELGIDSLESLIDRATRALAEQQGSRPTPATKSSIEALEEVTLDAVGHSTPSCAICLENMEKIGSPVTCMPCSHKFHKTCIVLWLERSNQCPLCRFELPTVN